MPICDTSPENSMFLWVVVVLRSPNPLTGTTVALRGLLVVEVVVVVVVEDVVDVDVESGLLVGCESDALTSGVDGIGLDSDVNSNPMSPTPKLDNFDSF